MPENTALWLHAKLAPFTVGPAPYTAPRGRKRFAACARKGARWRFAIPWRVTMRKGSPSRG